MNNPLPPDSHKPLHPPIYPTLVFLFEDTAELIDFVEQKSPDKFEYARYGNPTRRTLEYRLAEYEAAEDAVVCASGMSACTMPLLALLQKGDHLIFTSDSYLKTRFFVEKTLPTFGIESTIVDPNIDEVEAAIRPETKLIFTELPSNPLYRFIDLERLTSSCKSKGIISMVDSTLASPVNITPIRYGVDLVIHSMTKYFAGQNDLIAGGIAGRKDLVAKVRDRIGELGAILPANECYRLYVAMKTMPLRVKTQNQAALSIAKWLEKHDRIRKVHYPLLDSHIDSVNAKKYLKGGGCLITIEIDGNFDQMRKFCDSTKIFRLGPSFGSPNSLIDPPVIMSHWDVSPKDRLKMGITDSMVRLSIGLEEADDLKADIDQALQKAFQ
ncbi:MAG: aminotransferase class I/II-fold pyridoxal phosphate-dependent enzyme [Leptonema sp. (in: Bacteria)]|nr:aminotransferase class I/II-fold pyridoxal phosphate-dependent enzyme [Leptonema sp. (in: bacteria)]